MSQVLNAPEIVAPVKPKSGFGPLYRVNETTGCHVWARAKDSEGYGYFKANGKTIRAHVYFYTLKNGPVPAGKELDHTCERRDCCNPDHLEAVSHVENVRRGARVSCMSMARAREVRQRRAEGQPYKAIAAEMGITTALVGQIATNRCWKESPADASLSAPAVALVGEGATS